MPRIAYLAGLSLAASAITSTLNCSGALLTSDCKQCVTTSTGSVCSAVYTASLLDLACVCVGLPPPPLCSSALATPTTSCGVCTLLTCVTTTAAVGVALNTQSSADFGISNTFINSAVASTVSASTDVGTNVENAVVYVNASAVTALSVGASTATSVAVYEISAANVAITTWNNNAAKAKVDNSATLTIDELVTGNSFFSVWQNTSATASASASVTLKRINFTARTAMGTAYGTGLVHVAGGLVTVDGAGVQGVGTLKLSGGTSIKTTGASLPTNLTLNISAQGSSGPVAVVEVSNVLNTSGNIAGEGTLIVDGTLMLGSTTASVDPRVIVSSSAKVWVDATTQFRAKAMTIRQSATLQLTANTQAAAKMGNIMIEKIDECLGTIQINIAMSAAEFASANAGGAVALNYSSTNNITALSRCKVQVIDRTGTPFDLTSSTTVSAMGRRLLASSNTATWGSDGMSYTLSGQSNRASTSFAVLPVLAVCIVGLVM